MVAVFGCLKESQNMGVEGKKEDIRKNLKHYEILNAVDMTHHIVKRGANPSNHPLNHIKELEFKTLGR